MNATKRINTALVASSLLAAALLSPCLRAQNFTFTTVAGGTQGAADGANASAQFNDPTGVAVDANGNLYVADQNNNRIRKISPLGTNWNVVTIAGGTQGSLNGTNTAAQFSGPTGIVINASGSLYVADQYNSVIRQISISGTNWIVSTIAGTAGVSGNKNGTNGAARFSNPTGIAVDGAGNLFVADEGNNAIRKITLSTTNWIVTTVAGGSQGASDGSNTTAQFFEPSGVAVDSDGRVFVADQFNNTIRMITPVGTNWVVTTIAGRSVSGFSNGLSTNALFDAPIGIVVDTNDTVYVADLFNNAIRELVSTGTNWEVSTVAGGVEGMNNGTGSNASFNLPFGVAADAYGDIFVADSQNNAVRTGAAAGSPTATGGLQVILYPADASSAGAMWQLDGGAFYETGKILSGLAPGAHTINFKTVTEFTAPAVQTVAVTARETAVATGNYSAAIANAGSLEVMMSPAGSVDSGAEWRVDSGSWQTNGGIVAGLTAGNHSLSFEATAGWTTPASQTVSITNSQTTLGVGVYVLQTGSLQVTLLPNTVVAAGAKWQVDGGAFQASGSVLSGLTPGEHTVTFNTVLGWNTPSSQIVGIANTSTTDISTTYTALAANDSPRLSGLTMATNGFQFVLSGPAGSNFVIQASADLSRWIAVSTNTIPAGGSTQITDLSVAGEKERFYRAAAE